MRGLKLFFAMFLSVLTIWGCDNSEENAVLKIEVYGEEFIETGIPASMFADGWGIKFDKFILNIGGVKIVDKNSKSWENSTHFLVDVSKKGPHTIIEDTVEKGEYTKTDYEVSKAEENSINFNISKDDEEMMKKNGYSIYVEGVATKEDKSVKFRWGFKDGKKYSNCHSKGTVNENGEIVIQLTIHGDHLFMDDLASEEPDLRFDILASCDENGDGVIELSELSRVSGDDFKALDQYGTGGVEGVDSLEDFIIFLSKTIGHIDGEGHCE